MNLFMPARLPTVTKPLKNNSRSNLNEVPPKGRRRRAETVELVGKGEPCTEKAVEISEVDGADGSGGAEMNEGEGRTICDGEGSCNPEGW